MSRENAPPEASPNEASAPKPNPLAKAKSLKQEYSSKNLTADDWAKRHATMGYDPLDRALMEERQKAGEGKGSLTDAEYKARVRGLLKEHIESMAEIGICFKHTFTSAKLGFAIALARYGEEGRQFVNVEETMPNCECYPGPLKPTDELIAVNGKVILEPTQHRFEDLRKAIAKAPRPLKMTFIQGERREEAFEEQEERRALSIHDKRDATTALDALLGVVKEAAALAVEAADAGGAAADAGDFAAASLKAEDAERHAGAAFSAMGALARVGFDDRCAASKACYEGRVDAAKRSVDEARAAAKRARAAAAGAAEDATAQEVDGFATQAEQALEGCRAALDVAAAESKAAEATDYAERAAAAAAAGAGGSKEDVQARVRAARAAASAAATAAAEAAAAFRAQRQAQVEAKLATLLGAATKAKDRAYAVTEDPYATVEVAQGAADAAVGDAEAAAAALRAYAETTADDDDDVAALVASAKAAAARDVEAAAFAASSFRGDGALRDAARAAAAGAEAARGECDELLEAAPGLAVDVAAARAAAAEAAAFAAEAGALRATAVASAKKKSRDEGDVPSAGIRGFIRRKSEDMSPAGQEKLDHDWKRAQATAAVVEGCADRAEAAAKAATDAVDAADAAEKRAAEEAAAARAAQVAGDAAKLAAEARAARDLAVDDATPAARAATEAATARTAADALKDLVAGAGGVAGLADAEQLAQQAASDAAEAEAAAKAKADAREADEATVATAEGVARRASLLGERAAAGDFGEGGSRALADEASTLATSAAALELIGSDAKLAARLSGSVAAAHDGAAAAAAAHKVAANKDKAVVAKAAQLASVADAKRAQCEASPKDAVVAAEEARHAADAAGDLKLKSGDEALGNDLAAHVAAARASADAAEALAQAALDAGSKIAAAAESFADVACEKRRACEVAAPGDAAALAAAARAAATACGALPPKVACGGEPEFRVWSALKRANDEATAAEQAAHGQAAQQLVNACEAKAGEAKAFRMDADAARSSAPRARAAADKARGAADACAALAAQVPDVPAEALAQAKAFVSAASASARAAEAVADAAEAKARAGGAKGAMLTPSRQKSMKQWNADKGVATPEGGFDAFDRASAYYRTKDSADGMALREQCEAFARNCAVECADAKAHVHKFNENTPQGTKKASSGTTKMHALNMAAACVKRAADMAAQASELAEVAIQRAIDMKKKGAPQAAVDKADATGIVVRDAAAAAAFDAQNAARAFKTTSKIGRA